MSTRFTELRYQDPRTQTYLGSPSLVRLDGGILLATHDYFGPGCPLNHEYEEHLTSVYRSTDGGQSWSNVIHIANAFWSSLFLLNGAVYLLGTSQQYGSIVIRRSTDGGFTWTQPRDDHSGILFLGGAFHSSPNYHCAPVPVLIHQGRIYRAFEDNSPCDWPSGFQSCVISADVRSDLLDAKSWSISNKLAFSPAWLPSAWGDIAKCGWLEGNVVVDRQGQMWNILRFNARYRDDSFWSMWNTAAMAKVDDQGARLSFSPTTGFIELPGAHSKFVIRYDPSNDLYLTLSNGVDNVHQSSNRSVLSLYASRDLRHWEYCVELLSDDSGLSQKESSQQTGFQYVDWQFDGDDIIYLVRTAYDGAHNYHDSNRITFHRLECYGQALTKTIGKR